MDSTDVYDQYIEDMKQNITAFSHNVMKPYITETCQKQWHEDIPAEISSKDKESSSSPNKIPFAMKLFQRRMEKFTSYRENQKIIRRQNSVIHNQQVQKVEK